MATSSDALAPVELMAREFLDRRRHGERPTIGEYCGLYPELAREIRDVFEAILLVEELKPGSNDEGGSLGANGAIDSQTLERMGDYRILREIGRGGMGVVYEAEQQSLGRRVALKVLPAHLRTEPVRLARFLREARSAARLHHTNIVPVFDVGQCDDVHYYAMQFIDGQTLGNVFDTLRRLRTGATARHSLKPDGIGMGGSGPTAVLDDALATLLINGRLGLSSDQNSVEATIEKDPHVAARVSAEPDRGSAGVSGLGEMELSNGSDRRYFAAVARIGLQAAEALAYAHSHRVLHRDVKPANLILDNSGTVWLTDFGLAKSDGDDLTQSGELIGTLRYLAPERFRGIGDARSDVYGLGLTIYELATLRPVFTGSDRHGLIRQILHEEPPAPRAIDGTVPRDLETIIVKAIAKDPQLRYASAGELALDLRLFLSDRPIRARRVTRREHAWRWCRRNPLLATLSSLVIMMVLTTTVVALFSAWRLEREANRARTAEQDSLMRLYDARLAQAQANRLSGRIGQRFASLDALADAVRAAKLTGLTADREIALRSEAMACLAMPDLKIDHRWEGWLSDTNGIAFDSQYNRYARHGRDGTISVRDMKTDRELTRIAGAPPGGLDRQVHLKFSPRDRYLSVYHRDRGVNRSLEVWEIAGEPVIRLRLSDAATQCEFDPEEQLAWVAVGDGSLLCYEVASGAVAKRLAPGIVPYQIALRPGGKMLAISGNETPVMEIRDTVSGNVVKTLEHKSGVESIAWSPDGRTLAVSCLDTKIHRFWAENWQSQPTLDGHQWAAASIAFSHSGDLFASLGFDRVLKLWDPVRGKCLLSLNNPKIAGFSRDDSLIGATMKGSEVGLVGFHESQECRVLHGHVGRCFEAAFTRDGRTMITSGDDGIVVWDTASAKATTRLPLRDCNSVLVEPSDKGFLTFVESSILRWPIESAPSGESTPAHIGTPKTLARLDGPTASGRLGWADPSGRYVAVCAKPFDRIVDLDAPDRPPKTWTTPDSHGFIAVSPDGRFLASGSYEGKGIRVWDTKSMAMVKEWLIGDAVVAFSPDGRRLVAGTSSAAPGRIEMPFLECGNVGRRSAISDRPDIVAGRGRLFSGRKGGRRHSQHDRHHTSRRRHFP